MALKLTLAEALALLASAGAPHVEIVEKAEDSDYVTTKDGATPVTPDTLLMQVDTAREAIIAPKVIQAKTGEIHSSITGKINGALRSKLSQKTGIPTADLKDLESGEAIEKAYDFLMATVGGDKTTLIAERDTLMTKHATAIQALKTEWEGKVNEVTGRLTEKEIIAKLVKDHNEAKGLPVNANRAALAKQYKAYLDSKAIVKYNEEKDEIELYDKKSPDVRLYTNDSKTAYLKPSDDIKAFYTHMGIWNEDNRTINPADAMKNAAKDGYIPTKQPDGTIKGPLDTKLEAMKAYADSAVATT